MIRPRFTIALFLSLLLALPGALHAAAAAHDLGQGLTYYRLAALPADLPGALATSATVLDLRYAAGDGAAGEALAAWLRFHATQARPVFLLANADTAPALLRALDAATLPPGTLTLGLAASGFGPDVTIRTTAENERRAYDAFAAGTQLNTLVEEKITKPRYDEAEMVRRQAAHEPLDADADAAPADGTAPPAPSAPLIDVALQRAVHLHRALRALGQ